MADANDLWGMFNGFVALPKFWLQTVITEADRQNLGREISSIFLGCIAESSWTISESLAIVAAKFPLTKELERHRAELEGIFLGINPPSSALAESGVFEDFQAFLQKTISGL